MNFDIVQIIQLAIILLISIGVHEFAHAWTSDKLGDPTPKMMDRLTPNPLAHIDPIGFVMIFLINFGWGKPVITNPNYYRRPLRDECLVAFAGPISNIILALLAIVLMMILVVTWVAVEAEMVMNFWSLFAAINCGLAVFNMVPLPPLDGWRLVKLVAPRWAGMVQQMSYQYGIVVFVLLFFVARFIAPFIFQVSSWLYEYLHAFVLLIFSLFLVL